MDEPNIHPELQMQQMLQVDLLLRPANLTSLVPTWHGAPSQVNLIAKWIHLISPPQEFTKQQPKKYNRPRSQHNPAGRQFASINQ